MMNNKVKKMVDAYIEKQCEVYEITNNFDRSYHRFQGYVACLIDMGIIDINDRAKVLDYMTEKLENVEVIKL